MNTLRIAKEILDKQVNVIYPDGKNEHIITVRGIIERFKDEDDSWLDNFLNILINSGESFTNFGDKYTLIS